MRNLAERFVEHTREDGYAFDWNPAFLHHLDNYCDEFAASVPPGEVMHSVITGAGAYLGEMLVRNGGGTWAYSVQESAACVDMPDGGRAYPHNKVSKRITRGAEHSLETFYQYVTTGSALPGTTVHQLEPSLWRRRYRRMP